MNASPRPLPSRSISSYCSSSSTELRSNCRRAAHRCASVAENLHRSVMPYCEFEVVALPEELAFLFLFEAPPSSLSSSSAASRSALGKPQWTAPRYSNSISPFSTPASWISNSARAGFVVPPRSAPAEASAETAADSAKRCARRSKFRWYCQEPPPGLEPRQSLDSLYSELSKSPAGQLHGKKTAWIAISGVVAAEAPACANMKKLDGAMKNSSWDGKIAQVEGKLRYRIRPFTYGPGLAQAPANDRPYGLTRPARALRYTMRYQTKLLITAGLLLAMSLSAAALAYWGVTQSHFYLTRSRLAHEQLERQLQLSRHSQQLFKAWTDTLLTGMTDRPLGAAYLNKVIDSDLAALQTLIDKELAIVDDDERKAESAELDAPDADQTGIPAHSRSARRGRAAAQPRPPDIAWQRLDRSAQGGHRPEAQRADRGRRGRRDRRGHQDRRRRRAAFDPARAHQPNPCRARHSRHARARDAAAARLARSACRALARHRRSSPKAISLIASPSRVATSSPISAGASIAWRATSRRIKRALQDAHANLETPGRGAHRRAAPGE